MRMCIGFCILWLTWLAVANVEAHDYKVVCYFTDWSPYRTGSGQFDISYIDTTLCTHLIYAFGGITGEGDVTVLDPWQDLPDDGGKDGYGRSVALKKNNTDLKIMVSVGGWSQGSTNFSAVVNNATLRSIFVDNVVNFLVQYGFDGFDVDWEYPNQRGGVETDVENFVLLLEELREAFDCNGFILSAAVGAGQATTETSYNVSGIAEYVDFINLMTYEYHSYTENVTGHNTPLYAAQRETTATEQTLNIDSSVHYWIAQGASPSKILLGTAAYGKTFTLTNSSLNVPGSACNAAGDAGTYTGEAGVLAYYEICGSNWTVVYDEEQRVPYAYSGDQWVSYDNPRSMKEKVNYLKLLGLGGVVIWAIDEDDFRGLCGDKYPLLRTLYNELCI